MSEPEKQPAKVEPTFDKNEVTPANDAAPAEKTVVPAAANTNQKTEPAREVTPPVVDVAPKKEPIVSVPVPPAAPVVEAAPTNDNKAADTAPVAPVAAETKAPEAPVAAPVATEEQPAPPVPQKKGFLKKAFNFVAKAGVGAGLSFLAKGAAVFGATVAGAPAWATIVGAGLAVGLTATLYNHYNERKELKKQGVELAPFFNKEFLTSGKTYKHLAVSSGVAMMGSMLYLGFHEGIIQNWWHHAFGGGAPAVPAVVPPVAPAVVAPVAPVEHVVVAPPVEHVAAPPVVVAPPVHCATPLEQFTSLTQGHHVSKAVESAIHRVSSTNPHVHAQALKDLAYYSQYGFGGVPKDHNVALQLFKQAADLGNMQGQVDMTYLQHYGLDGIHADKAASAATMKGLAAHSHRAAEFVKDWHASGNSVVPKPFNSGTIVQGMKLGCA